MKIGTDTSFWAENVDYTKMVANGAEFTILRAGQGSWIDNYFQKNYDASEGMLPRSAYWFFDQRYKPTRQAELLAAVLKDNPLEGYIWADYERDYEGAGYAKWEDFHTFLREIERLIPEMVGRIGVYTRYYYFSEKVPSDKWYLFEKYPFWEARYEAEAPFDKPFKCLLWQYSEKGDGLAYGLDPYVKKFIDLNYFRGTDEEWEHFTGNTTTPEPEVDPEITSSKVFWKMKAKDITLVAPFSRTPDLGEVNKIQLAFMPDSEIYEVLPMPKYRDHSGNLVPNYETEADRLNLERDWAFIPIQKVLKNNGNYRMLHTDWDVDNWDSNGCYIQRQYLVETEQPEPIEYKGTVISTTGINIRTSPEVLLENKVGAMWKGSSLVGSELVEKDNGDRWLRLKDVFVAVEYNGEVLLELEEDVPDIPEIPDEVPQDEKPISPTWNSRNPEYFKVPDNGKIHVRTGSDVETVDWGYMPRAVNLGYKNPKYSPDWALPMTIRCIEQDDFIPLDEQKQWMWFELMVMAAGGVLTFEGGEPVVTGGYMTLKELKIAWENTTADHIAWTDGHSRSNGYIDYILKVNLDDPKGKGPMQAKVLTSGRQMLELIYDEGKRVVVRALDPNKVYDAKEIFYDPCVINWATQSCCRRDEDGNWTGEEKNIPFPWIRIEGQKTGTPVPFWGHDGENVIEKQGKKSSIYPLVNSTFHSPYVFLR